MEGYPVTFVWSPLVLKASLTFMTLIMLKLAIHLSYRTPLFESVWSDRLIQSAHLWWLWEKPCYGLESRWVVCGEALACPSLCSPRPLKSCGSQAFLVNWFPLALSSPFSLTLCCSHILPSIGPSGLFLLPFGKSPPVFFLSPWCLAYQPSQAHFEVFL